jgi:flagellar protein FlbD
MITLTRLNGPQLTINSDLVQRIEVTPDTVIHLADGTVYVVAESLDVVVAAIVEFRARVLASAQGLVAAVPPGPGLRVVTGGPTDEAPEA